MNYEAGITQVRLQSTCAAFQPAQEAAKSFWEALKGFENQTLWRYFHCDGDGE